MAVAALAGVRIVLVEPAGARNVGAIARVMKNMGLSQLVLVNPQCDPQSAEARQMAVHAADLLQAARQVATLPEALQDCQQVVATMGRDRSLETQLESPRTGLPRLLTTANSALIFGREDRGLSNEELNYAQRFVRIPSSPAYASLNLAQAVGICCYELYQTTQEVAQGSQAIRLSPEVTEMMLTSEPLAAFEAVEGYYQQLEALLLEIGYLYPHTASPRMEKFRRLFNRANLSVTEVAMLRGILSQMNWALSAQSNRTVRDE